MRRGMASSSWYRVAESRSTIDRSRQGEIRMELKGKKKKSPVGCAVPAVYSQKTTADGTSIYQVPSTFSKKKGVGERARTDLKLTRDVRCSLFFGPAIGRKRREEVKDRGCLK